MLIVCMAAARDAWLGIGVELVALVHVRLALISEEVKIQRHPIKNVSIVTV